MKLSIITITYNAEKFIERTLKSLDSQSLSSQNFEYLIIDGASKDKTLEIIKHYTHLNPIVFSEPDKGLYHAMNKGLARATGNYVWFMNAGDEWADEHTLATIFNMLDEQVDVLYGESYFVDEKGTILGKRSELTPHQLPQKLTWQAMKYGMLVCHQAFIAKHSIAPNYMINNLSADLDWEIVCLQRAKVVIKADVVLAKYLTGGISNKQLKKSLIDRFKVIEKHFGVFGALYSHSVILLRGLLKVITARGKYW